jgi:hypothetical protein
MGVLASFRRENCFAWCSPMAGPAGNSTANCRTEASRRRRTSGFVVLRSAPFSNSTKVTKDMHSRASAGSASTRCASAGGWFLIR